MSNKTEEKKLSARLREIADEMDRLDPCGWEGGWMRTCAALTRGNAGWSSSGRDPIECMEAELAGLYDVEKRIPELEKQLRYWKANRERS